MRVILAFLRDKYLEIVFLYIALQLIVVGASGWLRRWQLVVVGVVILAGVAIWLLFVERRRSRFVPDLGKEEAFQRQRKAVIFTLGLRPYEKSICPIVLSNLDVGIVGLLATEQVMTKYYASYQAALEGDGRIIEPAVYKEDFADIVVKTEAILKKILDTYHLDLADVVVNVTGGTVMMSLGAFFAAEKHQVECQVITADYGEDGAFIPSTVKPILAVSHTSMTS
jgi:hypothetical protein